MPLVTDDYNLHFSAEINGLTALTHDQAKTSDERELHIAIVNAMPAGAVLKTPGQFAVPLAEAAGSRKIVVHTFHVDGVNYGKDNEEVMKNYHSLDELENIKPDAIIVSGSSNYEALRKAVEKVSQYKGATSTLYSCMASHAYMDIVHDQTRSLLDDGKLHSNSAHWVTNIDHPLTEGISTHFNQPHSRFNDVDWQQFLDARMKILAYSDEAGVLAATSANGRDVLFQGHIEYEKATLLKEWNRDTAITHFVNIAKSPLDPKEQYPDLPNHYLNDHGTEIANQYKSDIISGKYDEELLASSGQFKMPKYIEKQIMQRTPDTHSSVSNHLFANWVNMVFSITDYERGEPIMDGLDPENPLRLDQDQALSSQIHMPE